jgi:hypothetical protein
MLATAQDLPYLCLIVVKFKFNERSYSSKNYTFPHRAPYPRPGASSCLLSSSSLPCPTRRWRLDRLAHGPALLEQHPPRHIRFLRPVSHMRRIIPLQSQTYNGSDSDDECTNNAVRAPAPTSSRGCSQTHGPRTHRRKGGGTTTPQPTATPSRSTHTSAPWEARPRARPDISACGDLISLGTGAGGAWRSRAGTTSCTRRLPLALAQRSGKKRRGSRSGTAPGASTDDLLARAALEPAPTQLKDVSATDVARRARSGSAASHLEGEWRPSKSAARTGENAPFGGCAR